MSVQFSKESDKSISLYHKDGLLEIFIGLGVMFAGLFMLAEMVWLVAIFIPIFLPSFQAARKRFLQPGIGSLEHNSMPQAQTKKVFSSVTLLCVALLVAGIGMFFGFGVISGPVNDWLQQYFPLAIGVIFACAWIAAAAMLKSNRFYLYAAFTFATLGAAQFIPLPLWVTLTTLGGLISTVGLLTLIRFVR